MIKKVVNGGEGPGRRKAIFHQSFIDMGNTSKEKTFHDS